MFCVYKIINKINKKAYIGITKRDPKIRMQEHFSNKNELLGKAKEKYGRENFILEILENNISENQIDDKERYYIKLYDTLAPKGYNLSQGGISNKTISLEGKKKLKECNLGIKNPKCHKYILMMDEKNEKIIQKFGSIREAARFLGNEERYRNLIFLSFKRKK